MDLHVSLLYLVSTVIVWVAVYHVAYWATAIARDRSLICWSLGPLGISAVGLDEPRPRQIFAQLLWAALALVCVSYASLFLIQPAPITGLGTALGDHLAVLVVLVAVFSVVRVALIVWDHRFPLWGEARVLARVHRSVASGAMVIFTEGGQAFLRERFGATPHEFLAMVRA